jgi:lipopolysaccharide transport system permease protein
VARLGHMLVRVRHAVLPAGDLQLTISPSPDAAKRRPEVKFVTVAEPPLVVIEPRRAGLFRAWREVWRYRAVTGVLGRRFLRKRFARTWLGLLWVPLRPVITLATKILVYGGLIGISAGHTPYPLFFVVASSSWSLFSETAWWSARSLELNRGLVRQMYLPRLTVVASALIPSLVEFAVMVGIVAAGTLYYFVRAGQIYFHFGVKTLLVPAGLICMLALGLGVGLFAAGAGARARDLRFSLSYLLNFAYFVTPVIYPISAIPPHWRPLAELNPLTGAAEMVRDGMFDTNSLSGPAAAVTVCALVGVWVLALWLLDRREVALLEGKPHRWRLRPQLRRLFGR